ncbi:hypothetical protein M422DRAFT_248796 [Sphaerobolus stellatus SS14]|nr:hypothetical protein M422DRAFT_248796 [Sphaerobolus stellatus SS14]
MEPPYLDINILPTPFAPSNAEIAKIQKLAQAETKAVAARKTTDSGDRPQIGFPNTSSACRNSGSNLLIRDIDKPHSHQICATLSAVCCRWNNIILITPTLWSTMSLDNPVVLLPKSVTSRFERTRTRPCELYVNYDRIPEETMKLCLGCIWNCRMASGKMTQARSLFAKVTEYDGPGYFPYDGKTYYFVGGLTV